jgi:hypothetical protein
MANGARCVTNVDGGVMGPGESVVARRVVAGQVRRSGQAFEILWCKRRGRVSGGEQLGGLLPSPHLERLLGSAKEILGGGYVRITSSATAEGVHSAPLASNASGPSLN